jgi:hypothetical protein
MKKFFKISGIEMIYFLENYDDIIKFNIESIRPKYQIDGTHQNMQYTT